MRTLIGLLLLLSVFWGMAQQVTNINDSGPGSLRAAIANAASGDIITFDGSLSGATITLTSGELSTALADLTIDASALDNPVIIDANNNSRVFRRAGSGTFTISNLIITNGNAAGGGGIFSLGNVTVNNSTILGNSASNGGGIFSFGNVTATNSTISDNSAASNGGGIFSLGNVTVNNSTISDNSADSDGSGIYSGNVTLNNSTISGNSAGDAGGGIFSNSTITVINSTISGNLANNGGGIFSNSTITVINSTISGNLANRGGGIFSDDDVTVTNSTISGNSADLGGGIFSAGNVTLNNSLVLGNIATALPQIFNVGTITLNSSAYGFAAGESTGDSFVGFTLTDVFTAPEPAANAPTTAGDYTLRACSPAINTGDNTLAPAGNDLAGNTRRQNGTVDMGAYESNLTPCATATTIVNKLADTNDGSCDTADCSLREAIATAANNDTITFDGSLSGGTITLALGELSTALADLTIDASALTNPVTIDANNNSRVFNHTGTGTFAIDNLVVTNGNTTGDGGGIFSNGAVTVTNSTISGNSASLWGGGIFSNNNVTVTNSTISGNAANNDGGGIFSAGTVTLNNSLVLGNTALNNPQVRTFGSITLNSSAYGFAAGESTGDRFVGFTLADVFTAPEPAASAPTNAGDYTLPACSPAINAGNNTLATGITNDLAGNARIQVVTVDMGAYESALQACQTIDFDLTSLPAKTYGDAVFDISGFASASSGLAVTFDSATPAFCMVTGSTVSIVTAGTCTIAADQAGNAVYQAAAQVTQDITIAQVAVTVTAEDVTITEGDTPTFTATYAGFVGGDDASVLDMPVSFADNAPDYNTAGTYTITPSGAADVNYTFTYNTGTLTIQSAGFNITESGGNTAVTEGAGADTVDVVLTSIPTADVVITVTPDAQLNLGAGAGTAIDLTFTNANWDTAQTINATAADDTDVEGDHSGTLSFAVASADANYNGATLADITVAITDDDAGVIITPTNLTSAEGAAGTSYDISLNTAPANDVVITITPDAQTDVGAGAGAAMTLTFTTANATTAQTVNVTAVDDTDIEGNHTSTISHAITTGDGGDYPITFVIADVTVDITDNDATNTGGGSVINPNQDIQIRNGATTAAATITSRGIEPLRYGTYKRGQAVTLDFLVRNPGAQVLEIGELSLPSFFSNTGESLPETLNSFESALLTVEVDTSTAGTFTGQVSLASNDPDAFENPFVFDVIVMVSDTPANVINVLPGVDLGVGNISAGQQDVVLLSFKVEVPAGSVPVDLEGIVLASDSMPSVEQASNLRLYIDGGARGVLDNNDVFVAELAGSDVGTLTFTFPTRTFSPELPMWFIVVGDF